MKVFYRGLEEWLLAWLMPRRRVFDPRTRYYIEWSLSVEVWKAIPEFEGYEASTDGSIRSYRNKFGPSPQILRKSLTQRNYHCVTIFKGARSTRRAHLVHHLVLFAFVGPKPSPTHQCRHLNGNKLDNRLENLAWGSQLENMQDRTAHRAATLVHDGISRRAYRTGCRCTPCRNANSLALKLWKAKHAAELNDTWNIQQGAL